MLVVTGKLSLLLHGSLFVIPSSLPRHSWMFGSCGPLCGSVKNTYAAPNNFLVCCYQVRLKIEDFWGFQSFVIVFFFSEWLHKGPFRNLVLLHFGKLLKKNCGCLTALCPEVGYDSRNNPSIRNFCLFGVFFKYLTSKGGNFLIASVSFSFFGCEVRMWWCNKCCMVSLGNVKIPL